MRLHFQREADRRLADDLYRMAWEEIAQHLHPPTRQWAGPHSRCYSSLLGRDVLALIQQGTEGRVTFGVDVPGLEDHRLPLPSPRELDRFFVDPAPREVLKTFVKATPPVVGAAHLTPEFALGTVNLAAMDAAALGLIVRLHGPTNTPPTIRAGDDASRLWMTWDGLAQDVPMRPAKVAELQKAARFAVDRQGGPPGRPNR